MQLNYAWMQEDRDEYLHLTALTDFAMAMKERLDEINRNSYNNFQLRVGKRETLWTYLRLKTCCVLLNY